MAFRYLFISAAIALYALMFFDVAIKQQQREKLKVIVLTVESLRHDMVTPEYLPHLLKAAKQSTQFDNHRAVSGWTGTNIVSLLTGLTPFESGVHTRGQSVSPDLELPLKQLAREGYTVSGLQPFMIMELYKNLGLTISNSDPDPLLWLAKQKKQGSPFFLWYHYLHSHLPYTQKKTNLSPHEPLKDSLNEVTAQAHIHFDEASYEREEIQQIHQLQKHNLIEFDQWFADFWSFFLRGGLRRDTILIITADHGEEHGERGMVGHASTTLSGHLHEEIVQIPLFIWLPEALNKDTSGMSNGSITSHIDIMSTLLNLLGRTSETPLKGRNIFSSEDNQQWAGVTSSGGFSEPDPEKIRWFEYSYLKDSWKSRWRVFADGHEELYLYNLTRDSQERENLYKKHPDIAASHREALKPLIENRVLRPVSIENDDLLTTGGSPSWIIPKDSGTYTYDKLAGNFSLQWTGSNDKSYILEYRAGPGRKIIEGSLKLTGNSKNFGEIGRRYWDTWIVPQSPYQLRIKEAGGRWSKWITIEARP